MQLSFRVRALFISAMFFFLTICSFLLFPETSFGQESFTLYLADFDGTITNTHSVEESLDGKTLGIWPTPYTLHLVEGRTDLVPFDHETNDYIKVEELPQTVTLSMQEYMRYQGLLGISATRPGSSFEKITLENGEEFFPSLYYLDVKQTYGKFRGYSESNDLVDSFLEAQRIYKKMSKQEQKNAAIFNVALPALVFGMTPHLLDPSRPLVQSRVITMRGHSQNQVLAFNEVFASFYGIDNPHIVDFDALSHPDYADLDYFANAARMKWKVVEQNLIAASRTSIGENAIPRRGANNPNVMERKNFVIVAENDPLIYNYLVRKLSHTVKTQRFRNLKIGLVSVVESVEWKENSVKSAKGIGGIYRNLIFGPIGINRPMTKEELLGEPLVSPDSKKQRRFERELSEQFASTCRLAFGGK